MPDVEPTPLCLNRDRRFARSEFTPMSFSETGKQRRLSRLFRHPDRRALVLPVDESLISGPPRNLSNLSSFFDAIQQTPPDGVLLFAGALVRHWHSLGQISAIVNLTASIKGVNHTNKVLCTSVDKAVAAGADLVAVHVNVTSKHETKMLKNLGRVVRHSEDLGVPVLAIMYPRKERLRGDDNYEDLRNDSPDRYSKLVSHCCRIGMELGADLIKTQYTGYPETFERVVEAVQPLPVMIAGGPSKSEEEMWNNAKGALDAGAKGISFGRNIFNRSQPEKTLAELPSLVHCNQ